MLPGVEEGKEKSLILHTGKGEIRGPCTLLATKSSGAHEHLVLQDTHSISRP